LFAESVLSNGSACYNIERENTAAVVSEKILNESADIWGEETVRMKQLSANGED
jgi:hypothetical protein